MSSTTTLTFHQESTRHPWKDTAGKIRKIRSYVGRKHVIFAITGAFHQSPWGPKNWIVVKLHSSWTWRSMNPENVQASTELWLTRGDADLLLAALLTATAEYDKQVEPTP